MMKNSSTNSVLSSFSNLPREDQFYTFNTLCLKDQIFLYEEGEVDEKAFWFDWFCKTYELEFYTDIILELFEKSSIIQKYYNLNLSNCCPGNPFNAFYNKAQLTNIHNKTTYFISIDDKREEYRFCLHSLDEDYLVKTDNFKEIISYIESHTKLD